jgi:hypothetical protein
MVPRGLIWHPLENRLAAQQAKHKENDKHNDENNEQYTRDPAGGRRYAGEPSAYAIPGKIMALRTGPTPG